jgi:hypothetical protein
MKDNMKHLSRIIGVAIAAMLTLVACGGGDDNPNDPIQQSNTYTDNMSVPAEGGHFDRRLTQLSSSISGSPSYSGNWLSVTKKDYVSGSPELSIQVEPNTATVQRSCVVTVKDKAGNVLLLTITQQAGKGGEEPGPVVYHQSQTVDAGSGSITVTLTDLKVGIASVLNNASWLSVSWPTYTSGSPKVELTFSANTTSKERSAEVTFTATDGNKVVLVVTQPAKEGGDDSAKTEIDDRHDGEYTDQPAYSRRNNK